MDISKGSNNKKGRIILLGDGSEDLTGPEDTEMFDRDDEDKDLESQVHVFLPTGEKKLSERNDNPTPDEIHWATLLSQDSQKKSDSLNSEH
jgi:protein phosphatase PTC2/3